MMKLIHKLSITSVVQRAMLPKTVRFLHVATQRAPYNGPAPVVWYETDQEDLVPWILRAIYTGQAAPEAAYLGTVQIEETVLHIYAEREKEVIPPLPPIEG